MTEHVLLTTEGRWFNDIASGLKEYDFRKGFRDIRVGDIVQFIETDELGNRMGKHCTAEVNYVMHSTDFPEHFDWKSDEFTTFQFVLQ